MFTLAKMVRFSIILLFLILSCSPKVISYLNDRSAFSRYNTFYLQNLKRSGAAREGVTPRIEQAILGNMEYRDYEFSKDDPDLLLRYEIISSTRSDVRVNPSPYGFAGNLSVRTFNESIILLELKDRKTDKLVWQASIDMRDHAQLRKRKDPLQAAVKKLFDTFPYRAGWPNPDQTLISND
mgnify:CR=1 FL=1